MIGEDYCSQHISSQSSKKVLVYSSYGKTCDNDCGIDPGFEKIDQKKWNEYPALMKKYKTLMKNTPEDEHTDGGHACGLQYDFYEAFQGVSRVKEIPPKANLANLFDHIDQFLDEIREKEKEGCNYKFVNRSGNPRCGNPIGKKYHDMCDDHNKKRW